MKAVYGRVIFLLYTLLLIECEDWCPKLCNCKQNDQDILENSLIKVRCGDFEKIQHLQDINLTKIATNVLQLNLSNNYLTSLIQHEPLINLQKLDLSRNQLNALSSYMFSAFPSLRRLDLSYNNIKNIQSLSFSGLFYLERLILNHNQFTSIAKGTFDVTTSLKQLDIANNPLTCDCELLWLLQWSEKKNVKLISNPKCSSPATFKGQSLRKLKLGINVHCTSPNEKLTLELHPDQNQVVFEGDSLKLRCQASSLTDINSSVYWLWLQSDPKEHFKNVVIENRYLSDSGLVDSLLIIDRLYRNHTGEWICHLASSKGNQSRGISIVVISEDTQYCPIKVTTNNKGSYTWPKTIVNYTVEIQCESAQITGETPLSLQKVTYSCSKNGTWENLNTTTCPFISETTKILEQFSKVNLSVAKGNIYESARHFRNFTTNLKLFRDKMDLVFASRTIQNYIELLSKETDLASILFDTSNLLLDLPRSYINEANEQDSICNKIVSAIEVVATYSPAVELHKSNIALEEFKIKPDNFNGVTCTWYINPYSQADRLFHCALSNLSSMALPEDKLVEASVQIPASILYHVESPQQLIIVMYSTNKLFPIKSGSLRSQRDVTSAVIGVKLAGRSDLMNLTQPIYIMLRTQEDSNSATPVWWNRHIDDGRGGWSADGCQPSHAFHGTLVFRCKHLGYYGLLQDTGHVHLVAAGAGEKFHFSHPAIYVGTFLLIACLLITIITYLLCYPSIQMAKRTKHALINTWIAIASLFFLFCFGVYQTENVKLCQIIGLILHYFSLSTLLWMTVSVSNMYKRISKSDSPPVIDELPSDETIQKPILGLYLVGWGIALILCGISGAVNMNSYFSYSYCFLSPVPAFSAVLIPVAILIAYMCICFVLIRFAVHGMDANGHLSEGTQATENVDLDLLEPNYSNNHLDRTSVVSMHTMSSEIEDSEHAPITQLRAYMIYLVLYVIAWTCAAAATVSEPLHLESSVFSVAYAVCATVLGVFTLFFYCIARNDVRTQWLRLHCWMKRSTMCFRSRNVSDSVTQTLPQALPLPPVSNQTAQDAAQAASRSSSPSSHRTKSQNSSNMLRGAAADLNMATLHQQVPAVSSKTPNVNLIVLHRQQYRANAGVAASFIDNYVGAEMFYNPHQSGVARKFFKKQKRHMMKRNNFDGRKTIGNGASKEGNNIVGKSFFNAGSKVNNTNIHIEQTTRNATKTNYDLNVLSDSSEQIDKCRKVAAETMRTVSQQCSLEYSSETPSDSVLDKSSSAVVEDAACAGNSNDFVTHHKSSSVPRIFVNPSHNLDMPMRRLSRTSSVSTSEIDDLYLQISQISKYGKSSYSDSEVNDFNLKSKASIKCSMSDVSDKVETTV